MDGMIVLIAAEKGGVGKSTLTTNLSVHLAKSGVDVIIVDTDGQATSAHFIERRNAEGILPAIACVEKTGDVAATLRDLARRYQVLIVDAGGRDSREMRSAMAVANLLIVPTQASQADLETLPKVDELVSMARGLNPSLSAVCVIWRGPTNPVITEINEARELLAEFGELTLSETIVRDRKVYRDALLKGKGVVEMDNHQAANEIRLLAEEFFDL